MPPVMGIVRAMTPVPRAHTPCRGCRAGCGNASIPSPIRVNAASSVGAVIVSMVSAIELVVRIGLACVPIRATARVAAEFGHAACDPVAGSRHQSRARPDRQVSEIGGQRASERLTNSRETLRLRTAAWLTPQLLAGPPSFGYLKRRTQTPEPITACCCRPQLPQRADGRHLPATGRYPCGALGLVVGTVPAIGGSGRSARRGLR